MENEIRIPIPEGMEIDRENSTFECIKLKPIVKKKWRDTERLNYIEIPIKKNNFNYGDEEYDCSRAIERDRKLIIQEAETSHRKNFDEFFDRSTLKADKVRIFLDETKTPVYGMILYVIHQRKDNYWRSACGSYYPFSTLGFIPHPYQESICW